VPRARGDRLREDVGGESTIAARNDACAMQAQPGAPRLDR
jgi:hypothetical protein